MAVAQLDETTYLKQVRDQYENLPYPPRDPAKELEMLHFATGCGLDRLNYYHFGGKRDFTKPMEFLVAGCGTGDAVVSLAVQLYGSPARITALDMSTASLGVAKKRLAARGLDNVRFVHDSLLNVQNHMDKPFDYINCIGVLHHLEVPEAGLAALEKVLAPDGMMHLMLYALYGRESVYQMQTLMRIINGDEPNMQHKVDMCRKVLADLPAEHGFRQFVERVADVRLYGDSGLYDLLLHSHDVAYTVPDVYDFLSTANLIPTHWSFGTSIRGNHLYQAESYLGDEQAKARVRALPLREQQAVAELMDATIGRHEFYAARKKPELPSLSDMDMVVHFDVCQIPEALCKELSEPLDVLAKGQVVQMNFGAFMLDIFNGTYTAKLIRNLSGELSTRELFSKVRAGLPSGAAQPSDAELMDDLARLFQTFNHYDLMFLRHKSVPMYRNVPDAGDLRGKKA